MTIKHDGDTVVYCVALCEHPLTAGEDDHRTDAELVAAVEERTTVEDPLDWPQWVVFVSDPPDAEKIRYVNTATRINVKATFETGIWASHKEYRDVFDAITENIEIDGFDLGGASMSHYGAEHIEDFDGTIHLDVTGESRQTE